MKKRVAIIGIVGIPAKYGGFETFAEYMSQLISDNYELSVYSSSRSYEERIETYYKAKIRYIPLRANGPESIAYDIASIFYSLKDSDVLLILGSSGAIILPIVKLLGKRIKIIFNMAGLEWKRSKWNKFARWFLKLSERTAVRCADEVVVDNQGLQDYIKEEYGVHSRVIAYGGDQVSKAVLTGEVLAEFPFLKNPYCCAVARIQPDNNIDMILEAFRKMPGKPLVFIGNWDASGYGRALKDKYAAVINIDLLDAIYDRKKLDQIRGNCIAYIHGHSAGGTNPSLVEAMHLALPIIAFDVNFNRYTTQNRALYFSNSEQLVERVTKLDNRARKSYGLKMKEIARESFTWEKTIKEYEKLFQ
jgi:glycosyltransferase involved in cell wall biosynthesis